MKIAKIHIRRRLKRSDGIDGTEFPLLMRLMSTLGERFGYENVRLVVWFG